MLFATKSLNTRSNLNLGLYPAAVANLSDEKVFAHFMPYIEAKAHPSIKDQQIMANSLIEFIDKNIDW